MADKQMPNEAQARGFKTAVLEAAAKYLREKPQLDPAYFDVRVSVQHVAHALEDLNQYFARDTGDEAK